jgi:hypothetical protein
MKKLLFLAMCGIALCACEKNEGGEHDTVPTGLAKSYISRFVDCGVLDITYKVGAAGFFEKEPWTTSVDASADFLNSLWLKDKLWLETQNGKYDTIFWSIGESKGIGINVRAIPKIDSVKNIHGKYNVNDGYYWSNLCHTDFPCGVQYYADGRSSLDPYYDAKRRVYEDYLEQIGDTCFNRILPGGENILVHDAITVPLQTISITSDKDFNPDFPAGAELNSLFHVFFDDLYATIKNGYKTARGSYSPPIENPNWEFSIDHSYFKEKLTSVNFPGRPFIGNEWLCILDLAPDKTGEYIFHIKVTLVNGTEMEESTPPIKIKGRLD